MNREELDFIKECVLKRLYIDETFRLFNQKYNRSWSAIVLNYKRLADELKIKGYMCQCFCGNRTKPGYRYIYNHNHRLLQKESDFIKECVIKRLYLDDTFELFNKKYNRGWSTIKGYYQKIAYELNIEGHRCKCSCDGIAEPGNRYIYGHNYTGSSESYTKAQLTMRKNKKGVYGENNPTKTVKAIVKQVATMRRKKLGIFDSNSSQHSSKTMAKAQATMKKNGTHPFKNRGVNGKIRPEEELIMEKLLKPLEFKSNVRFGTGQRGYEKYKCIFFEADFYSKEHNLVVELDGTSHNMDVVKERDLRKNKFFKDKNIRMLRFDICNNFKSKKILESIKNEI